MNRSKAQSIAEYAVVVVIVMVALAGINVYLKRGLQAKYKNAVDLVGETTGINQYEPYYTKTEQTIRQVHIPTYVYRPKGELSRYPFSSVTREDATLSQGLNTGEDDDWY